MSDPTTSSLPKDRYVVVEINSGTAKVIARGDDLDTVSHQLKTGKNVGDEPKPTFYYVVQENTVEGVKLEQALPPDLLVARNLLYIQNQPPLKAIYEHWISVRESFSKKVESKMLRLGFQKNEIYTLIGMYFVFQTALLAFSGTSTKLNCTNIWIPYALTFIATVAVVFGIQQKFHVIHNLNDAIDRDYTEYKGVATNANAIERNGPRFVWPKCYEDVKWPDKSTQHGAKKSFIRIFQSLLEQLRSLCTQWIIRDRISTSQAIIRDRISTSLAIIRDRICTSQAIVCLILIFGIVFFFAHRSLLPCHGPTPAPLPAP
ncbi:hypothetical protein KC19_7G015800 [Ceratodon purpureus]|uniref:Uncharacterized protein n=1 Tax=Ceratodon purpureus TaxID=3225 RepID=A0A8T0H3C3_CERPU|nr:hypothetical protein KC19_7G015800 [Ceratodon purpureus]